MASSTSSPFHHNQDVRCRKLEHVSFVAVHKAHTHLFQNHITRIALTASTNALAPSSPIWFPKKISLVIDRLALSWLGLRSPYLNLVSHGDKMTAPRKEEAHGALHTHRVCSPGVPHMYSHTP